VSTSQAVAPSEWAAAVRVGQSDVYVNLGATSADTIVWHWCPNGSDDQARWLGAYIPLHTIVQHEPLTITASLACPNGCPWHGFITNGQWNAV
jgi:hypothetical protein